MFKFIIKFYFSKIFPTKLFMVAVGRVSSNGFLQNKNSKYIIEHLSLKYLSQKIQAYLFKDFWLIKLFLENYKS